MMIVNDRAKYCCEFVPRMKNAYLSMTHWSLSIPVNSMPQDIREEVVAQGKSQSGRLSSLHWARIHPSAGYDGRRSPGRDRTVLCMHESELQDFHKFHILSKLRIRFCDSSTIDVAQLRQTMDQFLSRINVLFVQRKAAQIHCFTRHATGS